MPSGVRIPPPAPTMASVSVKFRAVDRDGFEAIRSGFKPIETRAASPKYRNVVAGDSLVITCVKDKFTKRVKSVRHFPSLDSMFAELEIKKIDPFSSTVEEAKRRYDSFPGYKQKLAEFGIIAFELE